MRLIAGTEEVDQLCEAILQLHQEGQQPRGKKKRRRIGIELDSNVIIIIIMGQN